MPPYDYDQIVESLVAVSRPVILRYFSNPANCIASTRIAIDVLQRFGFKASPLSVMCIAYNPEYVRRMNDLGRPAQTQAELDSWEGAWNVSLGAPRSDDPPNRFICHLVTVTPQGYLIDLSLDQASRPDHHLNLCPVAFPVDDAFLSGASRFVHQLDNGCALVYAVRPDRSYLKSSNWHGYLPQRRAATGEIAERIESRIRLLKTPGRF